MAIKVNGTTVVDDSRNLTNIASIDATTGAAISAGISTTPPTTLGAVGTYAFLGNVNTDDVIVQGATKSGSALYYAGILLQQFGTWPSGSASAYGHGVAVSPSGTWRAMGASGFAGNYRSATVFMRIS